MKNFKNMVSEAALIMFLSTLMLKLFSGHKFSLDVASIPLFPPETNLDIRMNHK